MKLENYEHGPRYTARVVSNKLLTAAGAAEEVRELELLVSNQTIHFEPGQSIGIIIDEPESLEHDAHLKAGHSEHFRLYTIADTPVHTSEGGTHIKICIVRCDYLDEYSGERYKGIASNYLCDVKPDDEILINGPFGISFVLPEDRNANILMIGMGTGIAPFRALLRKIYDEDNPWQGQVKLFYGARSGLEMLYMTDATDDISQYDKQESFERVQATSPRPHWSDPIALGAALEKREDEVLALLESENTYVYIAGVEEIEETLENTLITICGSLYDWQELKSKLKESGRWTELIY